jgi:hypothetical protein
MAEAYRKLSDFAELSSADKNRIVAEAGQATVRVFSSVFIDKDLVTEITFLPTNEMTLQQIEEYEILSVDLSDEKLKPAELSALIDRISNPDKGKIMILSGTKVKEAPRLSPSLTRAIKKALKIKHPS